MATTTNGKASVSPEIVLKAKRRRFLLSEKRRVLQAVEAAAPGMQGAVLRREGVYSSQIATWRRQMQRGDLDVGALKAREQQKSDAQSANRQIAEFERENRKLRRRVERAELIGEIQKKAVLDIFSRMVVGWTLVRRADAKIAAEFIAGTVEAHGIAPGTLTVHADRGAEMTAQLVGNLLDRLAVRRSNSRPHVSDDNAYSEAQFYCLP